MGNDDAPPDHARPRWSVPPPPDSRRGTTPSALGEEFLFHLYRGSELLKEDDFHRAQTELERALSFRPRDVEGQSLLGIVYFRLGHYPRAIQIYEELTRVRPAEIAPRINLALCYLKTGQLTSARGLLESLVQEVPTHVRAWGYLGLVYQRLRDFDKASVAFDRSGRPGLAARVRAEHPAEAPYSDTDGEAPSSVREIEQHHVRAARSVRPSALPAPSPRSTERPSSGPGIGMRTGSALSISQIVDEATLTFPDAPRLSANPSGLVFVTIDGSFHVRSECVRAVIPERASAIESRVLTRRTRLLVDEPFGGAASPFVTLEGRGRLILGVEDTFTPLVAYLDGDPLYLREDRIAGFDGTLEHESGRLLLPEGGQASLVQLSGIGFVVVALRGPLHGIAVTADRPIDVRATRLVGWTGRLLARPTSAADEPRAPLPGFITLSGTGSALVDG